MSYNARHTLPYRVEMRRQIMRKRTLLAYIFVVALPIIVAAATKFGPSGHSGGPTKLGSGSADLIGLATKGAANFTITMFYFATPFLLVAVVSLFSGDTVASEASWSTLRYLLAAPIPRARLLLQKIKVSLSLSLVAVAILPVASWLVGLIAFGSAPFQSPLGVTIQNGQMLQRILIMSIYVALSLSFVAALAFWISIRTNAPLGAVGVAVGIVILMNILDAVSALGTLRTILPVHYSYSWFDLLGSQITWANLIHGACYSLIWFVFLTAFSIRKFNQMDITS